eukprot:TRINITY_DN6227_c0_g1_i1.p1 TRINITY_DN6227_c0_g1~~TRINITY_DN6227_c0_g1_i1.p1  ORF type:complete len:879 (-),score=127.80 TRINITY_DN6227_c0_g1_i1:354-2990(-)
MKLRVVPLSHDCNCIHGCLYESKKRVGEPSASSSNSRVVTEHESSVALAAASVCASMQAPSSMSCELLSTVTTHASSTGVAIGNNGRNDGSSLNPDSRSSTTRRDSRLADAFSTTPIHSHSANILSNNATDVLKPVSPNCSSREPNGFSNFSQESEELDAFPFQPTSDSLPSNLCASSEAARPDSTFYASNAAESFRPSTPSMLEETNRIPSQTLLQSSSIIEARSASDMHQSVLAGPPDSLCSDASRPHTPSDPRDSFDEEWSKVFKPSRLVVPSPHLTSLLQRPAVNKGIDEIAQDVEKEKGYDEASVLIPGLPNDMALLCLSHLSFAALTKPRAVSTMWRRVLASEEFHNIRTTRKNLLDTAFCVCLGVVELQSNKRGLLFEVFDFNAQAWMQLPPLHLANFSMWKPGSSFHGFEVVSVGHKLLVIGGSFHTSGDAPSTSSASDQRRNRRTNIASSDVWAFDTIHYRWLAMASMTRCRSNFAAAALDDNRVIVAGSRLDASVEILDLRSNSWCPAESMPYPGDTCRGFSKDGLFYAIWHRHPFHGARHVHVYDPAIDSWSTIPGFFPSTGSLETSQPLAVLDGILYASQGERQAARGGELAVLRRRYSIPSSSSSSCSSGGGVRNNNSTTNANNLSRNSSNNTNVSNNSNIGSRSNSTNDRASGNNLYSSNVNSSTACSSTSNIGNTNGSSSRDNSNDRNEAASSTSSASGSRTSGNTTPSSTSAVNDVPAAPGLEGVDEDRMIMPHQLVLEAMSSSSSLPGTPGGELMWEPIARMPRKLWEKRGEEVFFVQGHFLAAAGGRLVIVQTVMKRRNSEDASCFGLSNPAPHERLSFMSVLAPPWWAGSGEGATSVLAWEHRDVQISSGIVACATLQI